MLKDTSFSTLNADIHTVLILILMEHAQRSIDEIWATYKDWS